jgi:hypothetical protein
MHGYVNEVTKRLPAQVPLAAQIAINLLGMVIFTAVFYQIFEKGSLKVRELISPRSDYAKERSAERSAA